MSEIPFSEVSVNLVQSLDEAMEFKRWLSERHENDAVAVDTETTGFNPRVPGAAIRLIQFGDTRTGWSIPWEFWKGLALEVLDEFEGEWVYHNIAFDSTWIQHGSTYKVPWHRVHDTMLQAHLDDPTQSVGLKPLAVRHIHPRADAGEYILKESMHKNKWGWDTVPLDFYPYWAYGAMDTVLTARLHSFFKIRSRFPEAYDLEMAVRRVACLMEANGSPIDLEYTERKLRELTAYVETSNAWAKENWGISIGSNVVLAKFLEEQGARITKTTPGGSLSVDKEVLKGLVAEGGASGQIAEFVLGVRKAGKLASTYFQNFLDGHEHGVLHPSINTCAARTSRMSIRNPALQTLPKGESTVRNAFIPREGEALVTADYSQIEMRLMAHYSHDPRLQAVFREADATGGDFFTMLGAQMFRDPAFQKSDKRRGLVKNACVPLDTQILTKRGWLSHDEVIVGDETVGYNFEVDAAEWTTITAVHRYDDAPLIRLYNNDWAAVTTPDHRWIVTDYKRKRNPRWATTESLSDNHRIRLAVPMMNETGLPITDDEAALLGWVLSDGHYRASELSGTTSQGADGRRRAVHMSIRQLKYVDEIDKIIAGVGCDHSRKEHDDGLVTWVVRAPYARDLAQRGGLLTTDGERPDPFTFAFSLSASQRAMVRRAMMLADGNSKYVCKSDTWMLDVYEALSYLDGVRTIRHTIEPDGANWQRKTHYRATHLIDGVTTQKMKFEELEPAPVWCVTTDLGSWTMKQFDRPMLTGNSYGFIYGAGVSKMAQTAGVPVGQMQDVVDAMNRTYPGIQAFVKVTEEALTGALARGGGTYVTLPSGRQLPVDTKKLYTGVNYMLQGGAAEVLKRKMVELANAGLDEYMLLPVHDEIVFSVPEAEASDVMKVIGETMSVHGMFDIDIPADPEGPLDRWGSKY